MKNTKEPMKPEVSQSLVLMLCHFRNVFRPIRRLIYYPSCGLDTSVSDAFPMWKIVYVDIDKTVVDILKKHGFDAEVADARHYYCVIPPSIVLMQNPVISPLMAANTVCIGDFVVCNDYHDTATVMKNQRNFEFKGAVMYLKDGPTAATDELGLFWQEVETEEEFQNARVSFGSVSYETAQKVVKRLRDKTDNVLTEYKTIVAEARETARAAARKLFENPAAGHDEVIASLRRVGVDISMINLADPAVEEIRRQELLSAAESRVLSTEHHGEHISIDAALPKKRGTVDDLFVFQKLLPPKP